MAGKKASLRKRGLGLGGRSIVKPLQHSTSITNRKSIGIQKMIERFGLIAESQNSDHSDFCYLLDFYDQLEMEYNNLKNKLTASD